MTHYFVMTTDKKTGTIAEVLSQRLEELKKACDQIQLINEEIRTVDKSSVSHEVKDERDLVLKATREMLIEDAYKDIEDYELDIIREMYYYHVMGESWGALLFAERSGRRYRDMVDEMQETKTNKVYVPDKT